MAIDDIVRRIAEDAENEAASLLAEAEEEAAAVRAEATARAHAAAAHLLAHGSTLAEREAETIVAGARLSARDGMLAARHELDAEVLTRAEQALLALADADYAALIARGIASVARGGETVLVAEADAERLRSNLAAALSAAGAPALPIGGTAPIERGVVLEGDRVRVEVSPASIIAARRADLFAMTDRELFGTED